MAQDCPKCEEGLPPWLATFADLMSLLMCFFVLLLSFAEIDAIRFKKMAESMKDAFGVQREIPANEIVKGVSVIAQEFSPSAIPEPSLTDEIRQQTTDEEQENLEISESVVEAVEEKIKQDIEETAEALRKSLEDEIEQGILNIDTEELKIIVRIHEKGSFPSGSAQLDPDFFNVMSRISSEIETMAGRIVVAGHTDNVPISTKRFRSNWELSSARAVTVVHALLSDPDIDPARVQVEGYADTKPLGPNDTAENRAKNRRVELIIEQGQNKEGGSPTEDGSRG